MQLLKTLGGSKKTNVKPKQHTNEGFIESLTGIGNSAFDSMRNDLLKSVANDARIQIAGGEVHPKNSSNESGDLSAGQELDLAQVKREVHEITEQGQDYVREIIHAGKNAGAENSREIQVKIQEILIEIKQLAKSAKEVQAQVEVISIEQTTQDKGAYHVSFLEQMLEFLRDTRLNVEDSLAWFKSLRSKKAARQYGVLAKKHGAQFMLSNERAAVTQTG